MRKSGIRRPFSINDLSYQPKNDKMCRIETVIKFFHRAVIIPLFSAIEPYRDKRKDRKALAQDMPFPAEKFDNVFISGKDFRIDVDKAEKLCQEALPVSVPEEIENQNGHHSGIMVIHKGDEPDDESH